MHVVIIHFSIIFIVCIFNHVNIKYSSYKLYQLVIIIIIMINRATLDYGYILLLCSLCHFG